MNFPKTVKGTLSMEDIVKKIDSHSETELCRQLNSSERTLLFDRFKPEYIWNKIEKVSKI